MVKVRMSRYGRKKNPFYRLVVVDERKARESDCIEQVGYYDPQNKSKTLIKKDRIEYWISQGAQVSPTVTELMKGASK